ncbi:potassium-transporting ATPase subunit B, partial [Pseudomonas syringae pv. tagetis]
GVLNVLYVGMPQSAIFSAIVFIALIFVVVFPVAVRGVRVQAGSAGLLLRRYLLIFGLGGIIVSFLGIKLMEMLLVGLVIV